MMEINYQTMHYVNHGKLAVFQYIIKLNHYQTVFPLNKNCIVIKRSGTMISIK